VSHRTRQGLATSTLALAIALAACEPQGTRGPAGTAVDAKRPAQITAFSLSPESLHVDKVGMRGGALRPDGSLDLVFTATVVGPAKALYLSVANEKCDPVGGFRATTSVGNEPAPAELGGALELGRMSGGIGVEEQGKFVNADNGAVFLSPGPHAVKLYAPNLGTLREGSVVCAYAIGTDGSVARSAPFRY
jgi:hypothetical protein